MVERPGDSAHVAMANSSVVTLCNGAHNDGGGGQVARSPGMACACVCVRGVPGRSNGGAACSVELVAGSASTVARGWHAHWAAGVVGVPVLHAEQKQRVTTSNAATNSHVPCTGFKVG